MGQLITVEGAIGVGKTTWARMLTRKFGFECVLEVVDENPFLRFFHDDPKRYCFPTQIYFLQSRLQQQKQIFEHIHEPINFVVDYDFECKDQIFTKLFLTPLEYSTYWQLRKAIQNPICHPDIRLYLYASPSTLLERVQQRERQVENAIGLDFVEILHDEYENYFERVENHIRVDTTNINLQNLPLLVESTIAHL